MSLFDEDLSAVVDENNTIIRQNSRQTIAYINTKEDENNPNKSIKIIERQSQPELLLKTTPEHSHVPKILSSDISISPSNAVNNPPLRTINQSSIKIENLVDKLHLVSMNNEIPDELNSTLEIVDHILNTAPGSCQNNEVSTKTVVCSISEQQILESESFGVLGDKKISVNISTKKNYAPVSPQSPFYTPEKHSVCKNLERDVFSASSYDFPNTPKSQDFKTPTSASCHKKPCGTSSKKTPMKSNVYQHITSPVASYIKNCPQVPLLKVVRPNKPLPATSPIPKSTPLSYKEEVITSNKENIINLPSIAYRSAVKTKVVDVPEKHKLPNQSAKKIISSLPKPVIMKHNHREKLTQRPLLPHTEDSFANLSYHQADVSVCTRKTAFNKSSK